MVKLENLSIDLQGFSLKPLSLRVAEGESFMIVGPSGAGKTLLLEVLAGLQPASGGKVLLRGKDITGLPPEKRNISIVYQDYALFPHLSVMQNIHYGLRFRKVMDGKHRTDHLVELLRIGHLLERNTETLSGGEKQRVALARALAVNPDLLLLDEPLAALDPLFRHELLDYLRKLNEEGVTLLMVTHDFGEVLALGERVAVLIDGSLEQLGTVRDVFNAPVSPEVASFVGMANIWEGECTKGGNIFLRTGKRLFTSQKVETGPCVVGVRPEEITLGNNTNSISGVNRFSGTVTALVHRGAVMEMTVDAEGLPVKALITTSELVRTGLRVGSKAVLETKTESVHIIPQRRNLQ
jgi:molybdate/tungstate transport system ATP-binding protein